MNKVLNKDTIDVVMYHDPCADGFGSAFCVYYYFEGSREIEYIGCSYNDHIDDVLNKLKGKNILMCDFSFKYDQLIKIISICNTFMILDHHKTAQKELELIPDELKIFDMNRSGVGITWEYMFENQKMPLFLSLIQDRDLWKYELPNTKEFTTFLFQQKSTFELFTSLLDDDVVYDAINTGKKWLEYKQILIEDIAPYTYQTIQKIGGKLMVVLYADNGSLFTSDIGNRVFHFYPLGDFSAVYYHVRKNQTTKFSLRSTDDREDVSIIAKNLSGGGHRNASGATVEGITLLLPYDVYDDSILDILSKGIVTDNYIVCQVQKLNPDWLHDDYLTLIKRKLNYQKIVFQLSHPTHNHYIIIQNIQLTNYQVIITDLSIDEVINN